MATGLQAVRLEIEMLKCKNADLLSDKQKLLSTIEELTTQNATFRSEKSAHVSDKEKFKSTVQELTTQNANLQASNRKLAAENDFLTSENESLKRKGLMILETGITLV